jgi:hypothetical protein
MAAEEMYTSSEYLENNPTWHLEDSLWKARQILKIRGFPKTSVLGKQP